VRQLTAFARWIAPALGSVPRLLTTPDATLAESFDAAGFHGTLRDEVFEPFLAGVLLETQGATSSRFARLLIRSFALGTPARPAQGMSAIPRQLAARLPRPVELDTPVTGLAREGDHWVAQTPARERAATTVVVATDPVSAGALAPVPVPAMKGVITWWFSTDVAPTDSRYLAVDARPDAGPVVNTAVMSNVAPDYAPAGQHLVQASAVLPEGADCPPVEVVRVRRPPRHRVHPGCLGLRPTHGRGGPRVLPDAHSQGIVTYGALPARLPETLTVVPDPAAGKVRTTSGTS